MCATQLWARRALEAGGACAQVAHVRRRSGVGAASPIANCGPRQVQLASRRANELIINIASSRNFVRRAYEHHAACPHGRATEHHRSCEPRLARSCDLRSRTTCECIRPLVPSGSTGPRRSAKRKSPRQEPGRGLADALRACKLAAPMSWTENISPAMKKRNPRNLRARHHRRKGGKLGVRLGWAGRA